MRVLRHSLAWAQRHPFKLGIAFVVALIYTAWLPAKLFRSPLSTVLTDHSGQLLSARIASDGQWRFPGTDTVPQRFAQCLLTFEDEYFYAHPGVNPFALAKSLRRNLAAGRIRSGGSTVTMQLARMVRGNRHRNYWNKLVELLLAVRIELSYKKSSILREYCNNAPFGSNVVGLSAAAWRYFGRSPDKLSWAESALLAVLPNAPSLIYPGRNQQLLLQKRNRLLNKLRKKNYLDEATYQLSLLEPLPTKPHAIPQNAAHVLSRCISEQGPSKVYRSTLNWDLQVRVEDLLNRHVQALGANSVHNACALVAETQSGRVLAYVGNSRSETNEHDNYVDIVTAPRSTGSILKPFLYAFALSENKLLPAALLEDVPIQIGAYHPTNFFPTYDGLVAANNALARSLNVPAVKLLQDYGQAKFHQRLKQLGFSSFSKSSAHYGLSLILGGGEASLWEIASAYASLGRALKGYSNTRSNYAGNSYHPLHYLDEKQPAAARQNNDLLSAAGIYYTFNAMTELARPEDYVGWASFVSRRRLAWKTGTSFGFRDAWAVGVDPKYTVAVWVGNADGEGRPGLTGSAMAAPLLFALFNLLPQNGWFAVPSSNLQPVTVCRESGFRASEICPAPVKKFYPRGAESTPACPFHRLVQLNSTGSHRVNGDCYNVSDMQLVPWFVLSPLQEYFYRQKNASYRPLPDYLPQCIHEENQRQMELVYPRAGYKIYVPVNEKGERSRCVFKAAHKKRGATLYWYLDGTYLGATHGFHQYAALPAAGHHRLQITDDTGETLSCEFELLEK